MNEATLARLAQIEMERAEALAQAVFGGALVGACNLAEFKYTGMAQSTPRGYQFEMFREVYIDEIVELLTEVGVDTYENADTALLQAVRGDALDIASDCLRNWLARPV